jgi:hypothetical protein
MLHGHTFIDGGFRPVISKEGPKWTQVVFLDGDKVRVKRVRGNLQYRPIDGYTLRRMARKFLQPRNCLGTKTQISKTARKLLKEATA